MSDKRVSTRRRVLLSWIPISFVALICIGVVIAVFAVQNSWWASTDLRPSSDQQAPDGTSMLDGAGQDYFTREGVVRMKVGEDALPATQLGLESDGTAVIEPLVPVSVVVLGDDGAFSLELVKTLTVTTAGDEIESVELIQDGSGMWQATFPELQRIAPAWGWTGQQLDQLQTDLTTASRNTTGSSYSAVVPEVEHNGALSSAEVTVEPGGANTVLTFIIRPLPRP